MPQTLSGLYVPLGGAPESAYQASVTLPNPVAGQPLVYTVPAFFYEETLNFEALFTTTATLGTRAVNLDIQDADGRIIAIFPAAAGQGPGVSVSYNFSAATLTPTYDSVGLVMSGPVPLFLLQPNWTVSMIVTGGSGADFFAQSRMTTNRIPTGVSAPAPLALVPTPIAL